MDKSGLLRLHMVSEVPAVLSVPLMVWLWKIEARLESDSVIIINGLRCCVELAVQHLRAEM
jgi:hypothetical protein